MGFFGRKQGLPVALTCLRAFLLCFWEEERPLPGMDGEGQPDCGDAVGARRDETEGKEI